VNAFVNLNSSFVDCIIAKSPKGMFRIKTNFRIFRIQLFAKRILNTFFSFWAYSYTFCTCDPFIVMYATNFVFCGLSEHINRKKADVGIDKYKRDNAFLFGDLFQKEPD